MNFIFYDMIERQIHWGLHHIVVKSNKVSRLDYGEHTFFRMEKYQLKVKSLKYNWDKGWSFVLVN